LQEETAGAGDRIDRRGSRASPRSICRAARMRSCEAAKHHPTGRGGGSLLASKVGPFLASAEALRLLEHPRRVGSPSLRPHNQLLTPQLWKGTAPGSSAGPG
jgi:hypothetical protein